MSWRRYVRHIGWRHLVGFAALFFALFPVLWIISASFNQSGSLTGQDLIPSRFSLDNYRTLFDNPEVPFGRWFLNTMVIAGFADDREHDAVRARCLCLLRCGSEAGAAAC